MIELIPRWTKTAIIKNFKAYPITDENNVAYHYIFEGDPRPDPEQLSRYFEIRYDGPYLKVRTANEFSAYIEISIVLNIFRNNNRNLDFEIMSGKLADLMRKCFSVYKYTIDASKVGIYQPISIDHSDLIVQVNNLGMIEPDNNLQQGTVEAHYQMDFVT